MLLLALIAVVMGANYVSAASRFLDVNRAYDSLQLELESFTYRNPQSPVYVDIIVENPAHTEIEVLAIRASLRSGLQLVGGGEIQVMDVLAPGDSKTYQIAAHISDVSVLEQADAEGAIDWSVRGEIQVRLDEDVEPVWMKFRADTVPS